MPVNLGGDKMIKRFEELDFQPTELGDLTLRRRREPTLDVDVYEVKLGEAFLMSSLFTVAEEKLATLGLAAVAGDRLDVLVGGLGLGYTTVAALADDRVASMTLSTLCPRLSAGISGGSSPSLRPLPVTPERISSWMISLP